MDDLGHAAAQCGDGNVPGVGLGEGEVAVGPDIGIGVDHALAVRSKDADSVFLGFFEKIFLTRERES